MSHRRALAAASLVAAAVTAGAALVPLATASDAPVAGATGIGDAYFPLDGNGGIDVDAYSVRVRYQPVEQRLSGSTRIRLTSTQDLASFTLDFLLPVRRVEVDGRRVDHRRDHPHELRVEPGRPLEAGTRHTVRVWYAGRPARYSYAGESNWLADRHEALAMNQPHMAPWWFPANDHPSDKALVDVRVTVPRGRQVIANGHLVDRRPRRRSTTWHWRADEPMSPYLAFFSVGDFRIERGTDRGLPWLVAVSRRLPRPDQRSALRLMRRTPAVVRALEHDLGDYPFTTTGGLTTGLHPGFALENQTRPVYPAVGPGGTWLVVHELAHQWFGDDVAVQRWRDIWLNEGFATFMEWRYAERHDGRTGAAILQAHYAARGAADPFWKVVIGDPGAARMFHEAVYVRGAMAVQALRNRVGDETFWRIVRTWLASRAGGTGSSADFEAHAATESGQELDGFFDAWLRTPAKPRDTAANGLG